MSSAAVCSRRRDCRTGSSSVPLAVAIPSTHKWAADAASSVLSFALPRSVTKSVRPGDESEANPRPRRRTPAFVIRAVLSPDSPLGRLLATDSVKYLVAGAVAGVVSRTVVSPLEVLATTSMCTVSTSVASGSAASKAASAGVLSVFGELQGLFAREGLRGFFKGNVANCFKVAPTKGIQFLTFEAFKRFIHRNKLRKAAAAGSNSNTTGGSAELPLSPLERLGAGGLAGMAAALGCYPLEVAKTLLTAHPEYYKGVFGTIKTVAREKGIRALYRGINPTLVAMFPYVGLEFMIYEQLKLWYNGRQNSETGVNYKANIFVMLCMGAIAGSVSQTVCHPLDVIRKRLQLQGIGGRPVQYNSVLHTAQSIIRVEGFPALYKGLKPTYFSVLPSAGVSYVVYEAVKTLLDVRSVS